MVYWCQNDLFACFKQCKLTFFFGQNRILGKLIPLNLEAIQKGQEIVETLQEV